jgi:hypothetical protein
VGREQKLVLTNGKTIVGQGADGNSCPISLYHGRHRHSAVQPPKQAVQTSVPRNSQRSSLGEGGLRSSQDSCVNATNLECDEIFTKSGALGAKHLRRHQAFRPCDSSTHSQDPAYRGTRRTSPTVCQLVARMRRRGGHAARSAGIEPTSKRVERQPSRVPSQARQNHKVGRHRPTRGNPVHLDQYMLHR